MKALFLMSTQSLTADEALSSPLLPELFGRPTQQLGWQGVAITIPENWNLAAFAGDSHKGNFRVADDEALRMEVVWETPRSTPDVERSIEMLLNKVEKSSKKKKSDFSKVDNAKLIPRSRKEHADKLQLINFGWKGDISDDLAFGWGAAWYCEISNRVIVVSLPGRGIDNPEKNRRVAAEVLGTIRSHGVGGWQLWSVYGLQLEVPEEFPLSNAKLQTGRLEFDWERVEKSDVSIYFSPRKWGKRPELLGLRRLSAANVVLDDETLEEWATREVPKLYKKFRISRPEEENFRGSNGVRFKVAVKDYRKHFRDIALDFILRRKTPPPELMVWHDKSVNKIFTLLTDLSTVNRDVRADLLDSLVSS